MKRLVTVTIEKQFEIEIADELFTPKAISDFEASFWELDEDPAEGLFKYAGEQIARYDINFIEGLGQAKPEYCNTKADAKVVFKEIYDECDTEVRDVKRYVIEIESVNGPSYVRESAEGDPGRTHFIAQADHYATENEAVDEMMAIRLAYPHRKYRVVDLSTVENAL